LAEVALAEVGIRAQEEGYDAVCIDTMSDSGVGILRSLLDIPVIGPGRVSYLTALMLGDTLSVLPQWAGWIPHYKQARCRPGPEVPVITPGPLSYKLAELVLGLGLSHSKRAYPQPNVPKPGMLTAMMEAAALSEQVAAGA